MKTNIGLTNPSVSIPTDVDLTRPSVFRLGFNHVEKINATQAWSLLFTGGRKDKVLGLIPTVGRFLNLSLIAML